MSDKEEEQPIGEEEIDNNEEIAVIIYKPMSNCVF